MYTLEAVLKLLGLGVLNYFESYWNIFDFSVTVNRLEADPQGLKDPVYQPVDTFKITKDGAQKFYNLTGLKIRSILLIFL